MGNSHPKFEYSLLTEAEKPIVVESFNIMSKNSKKIKKERLRKFWDMQVDPLLLQYFTNFLFPESNEVGFQRFAGLLVFSTRGTLDERITMLKFSMTPSKTKKSKKEVIEVSRTFVQEYVKAIVASYMRILRLEHGPQYNSFTAQGMRIIDFNVATLVEFFTHADFPAELITRSDAEAFFARSITFHKMVEHVFFHLYNYRGNNQTSPFKLDTSLLPICENVNFTPNYAALLDISQILFINSQLPCELQSKWRLLYSSQIHDESFSTFIGRIMDQGSTVIIVEDTNGYIFGGFATDSWALSPNFVGNEDSFLFTLRPRMRCFSATTYNDHYQYLNLNQQTMPNGLGIGGQFKYWGLWIDSEYGNGTCSEVCSTYRNYIQLAATKEFQIKRLEVWGVGDKPAFFKEESNGSILSSSSMERAVLVASGKEFYSEGFIEEIKL